MNLVVITPGSAAESALAIVARNDPNEQEHVFLYDTSQAG